MATVTAIFTALTEGCKLAWTIFGARNTAAMQANAQAATIQKIRDSVTTHLSTGNLQAVEADVS